MKIRNGFVSNSSSSSFLVMWDKKPESWEEVKNVLFPDKNEIEYWDDIAQNVFIDTREAKNYEIEQENNFYCTIWSNKPEWMEKGYKWEMFENQMNEIEELVSKTKNRFDLNHELREIWSNNENIEKELRFIELKEKLKDIDEFENKIDKLYSDIEKKSTELFLKDYENKFVAIYEYDDGDVYENGDIFNQLEYIKTSHH